MAVAGCIVMMMLVAVALDLPIDSDMPFPAERPVQDETPANNQAWRTPDEPVRQLEKSDGTSDADLAFIIQAINDSLQRNDLTVARVLLNEVLAVRRDLPQALALQKELSAREGMAAAAASADGKVPAVTESLHGDVPASRSPASASASANVNPTSEPHPQLVRSQSHHSVHYRSTEDDRLASVDRTQPKTHHAGQGARTHTTAHVSNGRPKTRAEVINELKSARAHGSMPRFGNFDPYGSRHSAH
jgi:hypothetical protein